MQPAPLSPAAAPAEPAAAAADATDAAAPAAPRKRVLWLSCIAHALHDGYTDMVYVLLPVWQKEFALDYVALAVLRSLYSGAMASLQIPAGRLAQWLGIPLTLALGTLLAALGYAAAGASGSLLGLCAGLAISGCGASTQHPLASSAVSRTFGRNARGPLSVYNFSGDIGKAALPAAVSLLVTLMPWRHALWTMSAIGCAIAAVIALFLPAIPRAASAAAPAERRQGKGGAGFPLLLAIGILDNGTRSGLLIFLPFLLAEKGASLPLVGTALALVFIGGAAGKLACGLLAPRIGTIGTVLFTEGGTAACIIALLFLPLLPALVLLPLLGMMLNGTSSVLYGTVPELTAPERTEKAFAIFYTGTIGSGALSPVIYGFMGDHIGIHGATFATAMAALVILPLALALRPRLAQP